jgi:hypothetical protein
MSYYVKRYLNGIRKIKGWLPMVVVPCLVYLLAAGLRPDRFSISQLIEVDLNSPAALSRNPVDVVPLRDLAEGREAFFLDDFAVIELARRLKKETFVGEASLEGRDLRRLIEESLAIRPTDPTHLEIEYRGADSRLGRFMVDFFAKKLIARSQEGIGRTVRYGRTSPLSMQAQHAVAVEGEASQRVPDIRPASIAGEAAIKEFRAMWRAERLGPFLMILALSIIAMGIAAAVVEWSDPSFKSVRQAARYLNIPVLGVVPNLEEVEGRMRGERQ